MRAVILALTCAFLETVVAQHTPTIAYISPERIVDIGETVELLCSIHYPQDNPVFWVKINRENPHKQEILSSGVELLIRDNRFDIKRYTSLEWSVSYDLQIKDIQETDAGFYQCRIQLSVNDFINAEVELKVRKPPIIICDNSTRSLIVEEGQPIMLECYASGSPQPRISWRRENNAILPTGGTVYRGNIMTISAIQREDHGKYYCIANNGVQRGARRNIYVAVKPAS